MAETISMPKLGFDMAEGTLVRWVKQVGENINKGDVLAEIETDKATVEVESSASGVVLQLIVDQGAVVPVNAPIAIVGAAGEKVDAPCQAVEPKAEKNRSQDGRKTCASFSSRQLLPLNNCHSVLSNGPIKASPLAKKIARDKNVDLANVQGTGPGGRVVRKDVEAALSSGPAQRIEQSTSVVSSDLPSVSLDDQTVQTTKLRQAIGSVWSNPRRPSPTSM